MVQAYSALDDGVKATRAQEVIAQARNSAGAYAQLALLAYQAGQTRKGDLRGDKALALTPKDMRENLKGQLDAARSQAAGRGRRASPSSTAATEADTRAATIRSRQRPCSSTGRAADS